MALSLLALLTACTGNGTTYSGTKMEPYFPFDGETRDSTYVNDDTTLEYKLEVVKYELFEQLGDRQVFTFEQYRDDTSSMVGAVKWSNVGGDSVQIHGWAGPDGVFTDYDPPINVTSPSGSMHVGDSEVTETGGMTFTSTFVGVEDCPVLLGMDLTDCVHLTIDDGDGDDNAGPIFAGDYWLVQRYWVAWMVTTGFPRKWNLSNFEFDTGA